VLLSQGFEIDQGAGARCSNASEETSWDNSATLDHHHLFFTRLCDERASSPGFPLDATHSCSPPGSLTLPAARAPHTPRPFSLTRAALRSLSSRGARLLSACPTLRLQLAAHHVPNRPRRRASAHSCVAPPPPPVFSLAFTNPPPPPLLTLAPAAPRAETAGYAPGAKKSLAEYAQLDAEDESLARWKASLGIQAGAAGVPMGPKVSFGGEGRRRGKGEASERASELGKITSRARERKTLRG
jgi:hypothetical protein